MWYDTLGCIAHFWQSRFIEVYWSMNLLGWCRLWIALLHPVHWYYILVFYNWYYMLVLYILHCILILHNSYLQLVLYSGIVQLRWEGGVIGLTCHVCYTPPPPQRKKQLNNFSISFWPEHLSHLIWSGNVDQKSTNNFSLAIFASLLTYFHSYCHRYRQYSSKRSIVRKGLSLLNCW